MPDRPQATPRCPICRKPTVPGFRPFCSRRCADVDLGRWFTESYAVPAPHAPDEDAAPPDDDDG